MSHTATIKTQVRDRSAVEFACRRRNLPAPVEGEFRFGGTRNAGLGVNLRGWHYPLVCKLETGELAYDNYGGAWGEQKELDGFLQAYAVEKAKIEARKRGHSASERVESDGSIVVTINT